WEVIPLMPSGFTGALLIASPSVDCEGIGRLRARCFSWRQPIPILGVSSTRDDTLGDWAAWYTRHARPRLRSSPAQCHIDNCRHCCSALKAERVFSVYADHEDSGRRGIMAEARQTVERPLSPHLSIYRPLINMVMSILHRITGGALYFGTLLL